MLTKKILVVNTLLASGANVKTVNGNDSVIEDGGKMISNIFDRSKTTVVKNAQVDEVPGVAVFGMKNDCTPITPVASTPYKVEATIKDGAYESRLNSVRPYAYTTPSESPTLKMIIDALVGKISRDGGAKYVGYAAGTVSGTGVGSAPAKGTWIYQGASLAAAVWKAQVIHTYSAGAWAAAASKIVVANEGGSGSFASGTAITSEASTASVMSTAAKTLTANQGLAVIDNGNYYQDELFHGQTFWVASKGFADASGTKWILSNPATYQIGDGTAMVAAAAAFNRANDEMTKGRMYDVYTEGFPAAGVKYDQILIETIADIPDQNMIVPGTKNQIWVWVANANQTNVGTFISALTA